MILPFRPIDYVLAVSIAILLLFLWHDVQKSNKDPANQEIINYYQAHEQIHP